MGGSSEEEWVGIEMTNTSFPDRDEVRWDRRDRG